MRQMETAKINGKRNIRRDSDKYLDWYMEVLKYCEDVQCVDGAQYLEQFDDEQLRNYYADGLSSEQTYRQLLSDLPMVLENEDDDYGRR